MRSDFPTVAKLMSKVFKDEHEDNANPDGGGGRVVDLTDLSSRARDIFAEDLIALAKESNYMDRGKILEWSRFLLRCLEDEAPQVSLVDPEDKF